MRWVSIACNYYPCKLQYQIEFFLFCNIINWFYFGFSVLSSNCSKCKRNRIFGIISILNLSIYRNCITTTYERARSLIQWERSAAVLLDFFVLFFYFSVLITLIDLITQSLTIVHYNGIVWFSCVFFCSFNFFFREENGQFLTL